MRKASISILKAHLSQYLDAVKSGEEVIVTDRGRPVARLTSVGHERGPEGRAAQLVREGRMRPPVAASSRSEPPDPVAADPLGRSLAVLLEERAEGR